MQYVRKEIKNKEEAIAVALPYIENIIANTNSKEEKEKDKEKDKTQYPKQVVLSRWQFSREALETTLSYIYDHLGHQCYMLCVGKKSPESDKEMIIYKLESADLAPPVRNQINAAIDNIDKNKLLTTAQKNKLKGMKSHHLRILQCILKDKTIGKQQALPEDYRLEYADLMNSMNLPNGVYILNLTDAIILKRDYTEALPIYPDSKPLPETYAGKPFLPIFSLSGKSGYADITMPNYDDINIVLTGNVPGIDTFVKSWKKKTSPGAVFRGGPSGCGYTAETNQRIALAKMSDDLANPNILNAGIVSVGDTIDSKAIKYDPKYGLGMMNTGIDSVPRMTMADQSKHKYIIHVEGNVNAYRLLTTMMTGSLILRVDSPYKSWADHFLKHGEHYVMIRPDLSDLVEKIEWLKAHDSKAQKIAKAGAEIAAHLTSREFMLPYIENMFWKIASEIEKRKGKEKKAEKVPSVKEEKVPSVKEEKVPSVKEEKVSSAKEEKVPSVKEKKQKDENADVGAKDELMEALAALGINNKQDLVPTKPNNPMPSTRRYRKVKGGTNKRKTKKNKNN